MRACGHTWSDVSKNIYNYTFGIKQRIFLKSTTKNSIEQVKKLGLMLYTHTCDISLMVGRLFATHIHTHRASVQLPHAVQPHASILGSHVTCTTVVFRPVVLSMQLNDNVLFLTAKVVAEQQVHC